MKKNKNVIYLKDEAEICKFLKDMLDKLRAGEEVESFVCGVRFREGNVNYYWSDETDVLRIAGMCTRVIHFVHDYIDECEYLGVNTLD